MRKWVPTLVLLVLLALLAPAPALPQTQTAKSSKGGVYEQLNLFGEAFERIRQDAVEPVADHRLIETAITGMLAGLDPHSVYLSEEEYKAQQAPVAGDGNVGSVGLVLTLDSGQLKVVSPRDGSPAASAGIKPGETIYAIDKEPVFDLTLTEVEQRLRGPVDSEVTLTLRRGTGSPVDIKMTRAAVKLTLVASHLETGNIGYIRLAGFDQGTQAALTTAVQELQQQASKGLIGYVVDLRNNPGGDFDAAVAAADAFLEHGDIAVIKGRKSDSAKKIAATPGDVAKGLPIVALVNGGTAREAELVAGALQDNHRAVLVGTKTFGESSIETVIPLNGNGAIRLTTARFTTPSGKAIQGKGLDPDLAVSPLKLARLAQGMSRHEADLRGALKNTDPTPAAKTPATAGNPPAAPPDKSAPAANANGTPAKPDPKESVASGDLGTAEDEQLIQALDVLRGLALVTARNTR
jgi:carboxyl-terminal processing protease